MCFRRADISSRCSTGTGTLLQGKSYFKINKLLIQIPSINIEKFMVKVQGNRTLKFVCKNSNFSILCVLEKQINNRCATGRKLRAKENIKHYCFSKVSSNRSS